MGDEISHFLNKDSSLHEHEGSIHYKDIRLLGSLAKAAEVQPGSIPEKHRMPNGELSFEGKGWEGLRFDYERPFYHAGRMLRYANGLYKTYPTEGDYKDAPTPRIYLVYQIKYKYKNRQSSILVINWQKKKQSLTYIFKEIKQKLGFSKCTDERDFCYVNKSLNFIKKKHT